MFVAAFWVLAVACAAITYSLRPVLFGAPGDHGEVPTDAFRSFQRSYLAVFLLAMAGDWLQGPYIYALYQAYGFGQAQIAQLFVTGFLSSAILGTLVGSVADTYGRRRLALVCCVVYSLSCLTKLSRDFGVLMAGRVLAGIATSLMFSVFESWLVKEHSKKDFPAAWMSQTFGWQTWGNGLVAIIAGVAANVAAEAMGLVAPFLLAFGCFALCAIIMAATWDENYGSDDHDESHWASFRSGVHLVISEPRVATLGLTQSLFESAMYCFVFVWTPALQRSLSKADAESLPFGWIFAAFMVAVMLGSIAFQVSVISRPPETIARFCYGFAALCLFAPALSDNASYSFVCFLLFEFCCGIHFPLIATLRARHVPEKARAAVMNIFRIPLNVIVALVLVNVASVPLNIVFTICGTLLILCASLSAALTPPPLPHTHA